MSRLGVLYKWMQGRFYFDELYNVALIQPTLGLARWTYTFIDKVVIDGILHGVARAAFARRSVPRVRPRSDQCGADALAESIKSAGRSIRELQTGQIQITYCSFC